MAHDAADRARATARALNASPLTTTEHRQAASRTQRAKRATSGLHAASQRRYLPQSPAGRRPDLVAAQFGRNYEKTGTEQRRINDAIIAEVVLSGSRMVPQRAIRMPLSRKLGPVRRARLFPPQSVSRPRIAPAPQPQ